MTTKEEIIYNFEHRFDNADYRDSIVELGLLYTRTDWNPNSPDAVRDGFNNRVDYVADKYDLGINTVINDVYRSVASCNLYGYEGF